MESRKGEVHGYEGASPLDGANAGEAERAVEPRKRKGERERGRIAGKFRGSALELNSAPLERGKSALLGFGDR